jgi:hypothetical protein
VIAFQTCRKNEFKTAGERLIKKFLGRKAKPPSHFTELKPDGVDPVIATVDNLGANEPVRRTEIKKEIIGFTTMGQRTLEAALKFRL